MEINNLLPAKTGCKSTKKIKTGNNKEKDGPGFEFHKMMTTLKADKTLMGLKTKKSAGGQGIKSQSNTGNAKCQKKDLEAVLHLSFISSPDQSLKGNVLILDEADFTAVKEVLAELMMKMPEASITSKNAFMSSFTESIKARLGENREAKWLKKGPDPVAMLKSGAAGNKAEVIAEAVSKVLDLKKITFVNPSGQKERPLMAELIKEIKSQINDKVTTVMDTGTRPVKQEIDAPFLDNNGKVIPESYRVRQAKIDTGRDEDTFAGNRSRPIRPDFLKSGGFAIFSKQQQPDLSFVSKVDDIHRVIFNVIERQGSARGGIRQEINVRLVPESLGEVRIKITSANERLNITIKTQQYHAGEILRENISNLQNSLLDKGMDSQILITMENGASHSHKGFSKTPAGSDENDQMDYEAEQYEIFDEKDFQIRRAGWKAGRPYHLNIIV